MSEAKLPLTDVRGAVLRCCRCGQCRSVCPTFAELRDEANAPRGRLTTVAALQEGRLAVGRRPGIKKPRVLRHGALSITTSD